MSKTSKESIDISNNFDAKGYLIERNFFDPELVNNAFDELVKNYDVFLKKLLLMVDNILMDKGGLVIESRKSKHLKNANIYFKPLNFFVFKPEQSCYAPDERKCIHRDCRVASKVWWGF